MSVRLRSLTIFLSLAVVASVLALPVAALAQDAVAEPWEPVLQEVGSVRSGPGVRRSLPAEDPAGVTAVASSKTRLPGEATAVVSLGEDGSDKDGVRASGTPISVRALSGSSDDVDAVAEVEVAVGGEKAREVLGASGLVFEVRRSAGNDAVGKVGLSVDYSDFADAFGAGFSDRLSVRRYPACA